MQQQAKKENNKMTYLQHFWLNIKAALKCFILTFFHIAHGLVPIKLTSHEWWELWEE